MGIYELVQNGQAIALHWKYTEDLKVEAMPLAESVGRAAAAKRLGAPDGNQRNWFKMDKR